MNNIVFGTFGITLVDRHGARLTRLPLRASDPHPVGRPHGPDVAVPPYMVDRDEERALVHRAVRERGTVEFTGPCGAGKSTLLRNAAPGACLRVAGTGLEDLLQDLMRQFYVYPGPGGVRLTTQQCAQALGNVSGVVALDDVSYGPEELGYLRRALPNCALVISAATPVLGATGTSHALPGLPEPAAVALLSRELGRFLPDSEMAAVRRLVAAVGGQPLALRQAAALVRLDGRTFDDLARRAESDPGVLDQLSISAIGPQARRALAVLTLTGGVLLPGGLLTQMADIAFVAGTLESLSARGLAEQGEDRFGLPVCKAEPYRQVLYRYIGLASALRSLGAWLASCDPAGEEARGAAEAALSLLGFAAEQRQWQAVLRLATVVERVLFVQGHWEAWQSTLAQGITAAQAAGDRLAEAYFTHQQGVQHFLHDRSEHARRFLQRALDLRTQLGDTAGAEVTRANLALLAPPAPPRPPRPPRTPDARRRVVTAVVAVVAVLAIGSAIGQALGGSGDKDDNGSSSTGATSGTGDGGTDGGGSTTPGGTESGGPSSGPTTSGGTTSGRTTNGTDGGTTPPITLDAPVIEPTAQDFAPVHIYPGATAQTLDFTVRNPNDRAIGITFDVPGDTGFSYSDTTCADQLPAGASCTVSVEFSPNRIGPADTRLTVAAGRATAAAGVTGTGYVHLTVVLTGGSDRRVKAEGNQPGVMCTATTSPTNCGFDISTDGLALRAFITDSGFLFQGWTGACTGPNPCTPALTQDATATATFSPAPPR